MSRRSPFDEIEELFERMNEELSELSGEFSESFDDPPVGESFDDPPVDVIERDDELAVFVDLPGFDADEIDVSVAGRELTVEAERASTVETETTRVHRRERPSSSVSRRLQLPTDVAAADASATHDRGVVRVTLPVASVTEQRTIEVE